MYLQIYNQELIPICIPFLIDNAEITSGNDLDGQELHDFTETRYWIPGRYVSPSVKVNLKLRNGQTQETNLASSVNIRNMYEILGIAAAHPSPNFNVTRPRNVNILITQIFETPSQHVRHHYLIKDAFLRCFNHAVVDIIPDENVPGGIDTVIEAIDLDWVGNGYQRASLIVRDRVTPLPSIRIPAELIREYEHYIGWEEYRRSSVRPFRTDEEPLVDWIREGF